MQIKRPRFAVTLISFEIRFVFIDLALFLHKYRVQD